jgi:hypothetical protein
LVVFLASSDFGAASFFAAFGLAAGLAFLTFFAAADNL